MKLLITEFRQESNSFSPLYSDMLFWSNNGWVLPPSEVRARLRGTGTALGGMLEEIELWQSEKEVIFGPALYAQSGGTAAQDVMDFYTDQLIEVIHEAGNPDAIFFSFHGALQTTEFDDAEAEVLRRIRDVVGDTCVITVSTDLHGFISRDFAARADFICGYQTYPHIDFVETGRRAAKLALRKLDSSRPAPVLAWAPVPMIVSASAYNSLEGLFADLIADGRQLVNDGTILDFTVYQMQPWLDVADPNSAVVVIAETESVAVRYANELAERLYASRHAFEVSLATIDEVIDRALGADDPKPVILMDSADSNNAGAPGDSMAVAARLLERSTMPQTATVVSDSRAVAHAHELGVGALAEFEIGGLIDTRVPRIKASGYVRSLHDGKFRPEVIGHTGDEVNVGRAAVIQFGNLHVMVCEHIAGNGDPQLYRAFGIEPTMYDLVVVKANTSFRAGYKKIAGTIVPTDTPGTAAAMVADLPFTRLPRTIFPWVDAPFRAAAEVPRRLTTRSSESGFRARSASTLEGYQSDLGL